MLHPRLFLFPVLAAGLSLPSSPPDDAVAVSKCLNSFSIEFRDFPAFAGTTDAPNEFSINLLQNLANRTGEMPKVRVGGSTQDDAIFISNQTEAIIVDGTTNGSDRAKITIGPSFYSSYGTFPSTSYIAGITLAVNGSAGNETRQSEAASILKALGGNLHSYEIGNEPDLYSYWHRRSSDWDAPDYVQEWREANQVVDSASGGNVPFSAPSFAGTDVGSTGNTLAPLPAFQNGLNQDGAITEIFGHNYMGSATGSGVSLQSTLMNHQAVIDSISSHVTLAQQLQQYCQCPYIMGETNSLSGGGATGLSNVFGAALWVVDYALYQATQNFTRVHFHQSGTSPYSAWAPTASPPTTNAPYYGNVMVAAAVGDEDNVEVSYIDAGNGDDYVSAYLMYVGQQLTRMAILNMHEYTSNSGGRGSQTFALSVPSNIQSARIERLTAAGADVTTNVTFAGVSYDYALNKGLPVVTNQTATTESIQVNNGVLNVLVQDTEAVLLHFM